MYATAGAVIEAVSGVAWDEFIRQRIFQVVGMSDSIPLIAELAARPNQASPHFEIDGTVEVIENADVDPVAAAGSIWSSVSDMARWLNVMLEGGVVAGSDDGPRLVSAEVGAELLKPQTLVPSSGFYPTAQLTRPHWTTYALGWFQHDYNGRAVSFHTGSIDGMVAIAGMIPDERLGVYVLANLDHAELRHALMYTVFDLFSPTDQGRSGRDWSADLLELYGGLRDAAPDQGSSAEATRVEGTSPSLPLEQYAGTYSHSLSGTVDVTIDDGVLRLRSGNRFEGVLEHWHFDTFRARWSRRWYGSSAVTFILDSAGEPTRVEVDGGSYTRVAEEEPAEDEPEASG